MRHIPKPDRLHAMKESLCDLENTKLINPNDLEILQLRRILKEQIAALERHQSQLHGKSTKLRLRNRCLTAVPVR